MGWGALCETDHAELRFAGGWLMSGAVPCLSVLVQGLACEIGRKYSSWPNKPFFAGWPNDQAFSTWHVTKLAMVCHVPCSSPEVRPSFIVHVVYPLSFIDDMGFLHWSNHPLFTYDDLPHPTNTIPNKGKIMHL